MAITDELREYAKGLFNTRGTVLDIADRIDAVHEEALVNSYFDGVFSDEELAENGFVRLPKDADGEYIHVGDVMEWIDPDGEFSLVCEVDAVGVECFFAWDKANGRYAQKSAKSYRHHKQPTVEDLLRDLIHRYDELRLGPNAFDPFELLAEYAAKLRLAGDAE